MRAPETLRLRTNSKLNLWLTVAGRRPDGFHELESVFHSVSLADDVVIEPRAGKDVQVTFSADGAGDELPPSTDNTVTRAVAALGSVPRGLRIEVRKRIPIGAGLAGGSGNAAGVILALNDLWELGLPFADLLEVAAKVGSDVPYCLSGGTVLVMSRGEVLRPLPAPVRMTFVLGISNRPLLTRDVYDAFDDLPRVESPKSAPMILALAEGDVGEVAALLHNDLERAAFELRPELAAAKEAMARSGALGVGLTGSGPTVFGLVEDGAGAERVAARVESSFDRVEVVETTDRCIDPGGRAAGL